MSYVNFAGSIELTIGSLPPRTLSCASAETPEINNARSARKSRIATCRNSSLILSLIARHRICLIRGLTQKAKGAAHRTILPLGSEKPRWVGVDWTATVRQRIQLALLLAVALVLLAAPGCKAPQNGISVELAKTVNGHKMAEALKGDALVVTVRNDNQLFLGTDRIASDMLIARAKDWSYDHIDRRVFIKADADARYGTLLEMFDSLRDAGVTEFGLLTKQRDAKKSSEE